MIQLTTPLNLSVFHHSYGAAHQALLQQLKALPSEQIVWQKSFQHPLKGAEGETLSCEMFLLSNAEQPTQILVLQSGTHGIEGYMGSGVQLDIMHQLPNLLAQHPQLGVLIIHGLNPWGFSWQRRGDHENIDLNRNFIDFTHRIPENNDYDFLANQALIVWNNRHTRPEPISAFVGPLTQGQYHNQQGIFYGGTAPSWSNQILQKLKQQAFWASAQRIVVLDLHTGLGAYGYGELINDHLPNTNGFESVVHTYGANACSACLGESCSAPKTGLVDYFWHELIGDRGHFVTLEFGTFAIEALVGLLLEEQDYQNALGAKPRDLQAPEVKALLHFFYPFEVSWQQSVLFRSRQVMNLALKNWLLDTKL